MLSRPSFPAWIAPSVLALAACGTTVESGGDTTTKASDTTTTSTGTTTDTAPGACAATPPSGPCAPAASCPGAGSACLAATTPGSATTFGLRVAHLAFTQPAAFTKGLVASVLAGDVTPGEPTCNLLGQGTFSWLIRFDTAAGTITTGGAKPPLPGQPYQFLDGKAPNGTGTGFVPLSPITVPLQLDGCTFASSSDDVVLPVFLDASASQAVMLPMRGLHFRDGVLSGDHACIGRYNAAGLDPANACQPDDLHPSFVDGATVEARIHLEDADQIAVGPLSMSLCVLLSGNPAQFGDGAQPIQRCKRDGANQIVLPGDWCAATDQPAGGGCADAVRVSATIAARAAAIQ